MHRLFGKAKEEPKAPAPAPVPLSEHISKLEGRVPELEKKIADCDRELLGIKQQMGKCRTAAQQQPLKQRALQILKRKQMYANQRDQMQQRAFNLEQTSYAIDSINEAKTHMEVLK